VTTNGQTTNRLVAQKDRQTFGSVTFFGDGVHFAMYVSSILADNNRWAVRRPAAGAVRRTNKTIRKKQKTWICGILYYKQTTIVMERLSVYSVDAITRRRPLTTIHPSSNSSPRIASGGDVRGITFAPYGDHGERTPLQIAQQQQQQQQE